MSIDEKDKKILAELDHNSRQTDSEIAKKTNLSKQVVNYRIQNLIKKGVIHNFYTIVNISKFGWDCYYVFLQLKNINKQQEKELLNKIKNHDCVGWLVSGIGRWDALLGINANSVLNFETTLNEMIKLCGNHLNEYIFTTLISAEHLSYKFLPSEEVAHGVKQGAEVELVKLDKEDKKILTTISQNARMNIIDIANKTKIPTHVVNYHLKNIIKSNIIEGFKPKLDIAKLGYQWYLLLIQVENTTEQRKREFLNFCKAHKKIYYVTSTIGIYNAMMDIHVKTIEEFKEVLLDIKEKFSDIVRLYESMTIFEEHKIEYLSESLV